MGGLWSMPKTPATSASVTLGQAPFHMHSTHNNDEWQLGRSLWYLSLRGTFVFKLNKKLFLQGSHKISEFFQVDTFKDHFCKFKDLEQQ